MSIYSCIEVQLSSVECMPKEGCSKTCKMICIWEVVTLVLYLWLPSCHIHLVVGQGGKPCQSTYLASYLFWQTLGLASLLPHCRDIQSHDMALSWYAFPLARSTSILGLPRGIFPTALPLVCCPSWKWENGDMRLSYCCRGDILQDRDFRK